MPYQKCVRVSRDMYDLSGELAAAALRRIGRHRPAIQEIETSTPADQRYAEAVSAVMHEIASTQANLELAEHLSALTDRLLAARRCEPQLFAHAIADSTELRMKWDMRALPDLRRTLRLHFRQRMDRADAIARLLAEHAGEP